MPFAGDEGVFERYAFPGLDKSLTANMRQPVPDDMLTSSDSEEESDAGLGALAAVATDVSGSEGDTSDSEDDTSDSDGDHDMASYPRPDFDPLETWINADMDPDLCYRASLVKLGYDSEDRIVSLRNGVLWWSKDVQPPVFRELCTATLVEPWRYTEQLRTLRVSLFGNESLLIDADDVVDVEDAAKVAKRNERFRQMYLTRTAALAAEAAVAEADTEAATESDDEDDAERTDTDDAERTDTDDAEHTDTDEEEEHEPTPQPTPPRVQKRKLSCISSVPLFGKQAALARQQAIDASRAACGHKKAKKPRRSWQSVARKEIRREEKRSIHTFAIPQLSFSRLVREIMSDASIVGNDRIGFRIQGLALRALQEAAEAHMVKFFENNDQLADHAGRVTVQKKDLDRANRLFGYDK